MRKLTLREQLAYQFALALVALFVLMPIWGMARLAFDEALKGAPVTFRLWPEEFSFAAFQKVWKSPSQSPVSWVDCIPRLQRLQQKFF